MPAVRNGAQWASGSPEPNTVTPIVRARPGRDGRRPSKRNGALAIAITALFAASLIPGSPTTSSADAATDYLLMPRAELMSLPTSGTGWSDLKEVADESLGSPNLCDQDSDHHLRTLAASLVYARTGSSSYATKARGGVMAAIKTQKVGCGNAVLALGRQLPAYVLAADFAGLSGGDDSTFRSWLSAIRTKDIGGHSKWYSLVATQRDSANNWGTHAGAARIAASLYLGDSNDVDQASRIARGFLGDRSAYSGFRKTLSGDDLSWSCEPASTYTPVNRSCTKSGINVDGAIVTDASRGGSLRWPPGGDGMSYQMEGLTPLLMQLELLYRNGYGKAWTWSSSAALRAARFVQRADDAGGQGWNSASAFSQAPWLLNVRYGESFPTRHVAMGRGIGFSGWLWGAGGGGGGGGGDTGDPPTVRKPSVQLSTTSSVPTSGTPVVLTWGLVSTDDGLKRYELQRRTNDGSWTKVTLLSSKATSHRFTLGATSEYGFRVRAVDNEGRVGPWESTESKVGWRVDDASKWLAWKGTTWSTRSKSSYIEGKAHRSGTKGAAVSFTFTGSSIAVVAPVASNYGKAFISIDGKYVKTIDLKASTSASRKIVFATSVKQGKHTIEVTAAGTSGRPTIYVDAFFVIVQK